MYSITKVGDRVNSPKIREFVIDSPDSLNELPHIHTEGLQQNNDTSSNDCVLPGSTCIVLSTSQVYMLGNDDVWYEL